MPTHKCPRSGCSTMVPNSKYACITDWFHLKPETRKLIYRTSQLPVLDPQRRAAFQAARDDWEGR